jgi:hypothetical protein
MTDTSAQKVIYLDEILGEEAINEIAYEDGELIFMPPDKTLMIVRMAQFWPSFQAFCECLALSLTSSTIFRCPPSQSTI